MQPARRLTDLIVATDRRERLMLSALDLARRIEAGEFTPRAAVELCAEAIAAREADIGAFVVLDLDGARARCGQSRGWRRRRCAACRSASRTFSTPPTCRPQYGSPIYAGYRPRADASAVAMVRRAGGIMLGKTVTTEFASLQPAADPQPAQSRAHAGRLVLGLGGGASPPAWCRSRSAPRPAAR